MTLKQIIETENSFSEINVRIKGTTYPLNNQTIEILREYIK